MSSRWPLHDRLASAIDQLRPHLADPCDRQILDHIETGSHGLWFIDSRMVIVSALAAKVDLQFDFSHLDGKQGSGGGTAPQPVVSGELWFHVGHPLAGFRRNGKDVETLPWGTTIHDILVKAGVFKSKSQSKKNWQGGELQNGMNTFENVGKGKATIVVVADAEGHIFER